MLGAGADVAEPPAADDEPADAGDGDTIADELAVVAAAPLPDDELVDGALAAVVLVVDVVVLLDWVVLPAKGSRGLPDRPALAEALLRAWVTVTGVAGMAGAGAGAADPGVLPLAGVPFSRNSGTPATTAASSAMTIHSLRSTRSRRSALMVSLRA